MSAERAEWLALTHAYDFIPAMAFGLVAWASVSIAVGLYFLFSIWNSTARLAAMTPAQRSRLFWIGLAFLSGPFAFGAGATAGIELLAREHARLIASVTGAGADPPVSYFVIKLAVGAASTAFVLLPALWATLWRGMGRTGPGA